jgi:hypothetical protein
MNVIIWPYTDPQSLMIADTQSLFAETGDIPPERRLTVQLQPEDVSAHEQLLQEAKEAKSAKDVSDTRGENHRRFFADAQDCSVKSRCCPPA